LSDENDSVWAATIQLQLEGRDYWGDIDGSYPEPDMSSLDHKNIIPIGYIIAMKEFIEEGN